MLTEYRPRPESTDSEYNYQQAALDESASTAARLRVENAELRAQLAGLNAHIDSRRTSGTLHADDGPETVYCANCPLPIFYDKNDQVWRHVDHEGITCGSAAYRNPEDHATPLRNPYDATADEDSAEYQFPEEPKTIDSVVAAEEGESVYLPLWSNDDDTTFPHRVFPTQEAAQEWINSDEAKGPKWEWTIVPLQKSGF